MINLLLLTTLTPNTLYSIYMLLYASIIVSLKISFLYSICMPKIMMSSEQYLTKTCCKLFAGCFDFMLLALG